MKLLVTGAGGFLGSAVAIAAARAGHEVVAVSRRPTPERLSGVGGLTLRVADIEEHAAVDFLLAAERPDIVVHSAWSGLAGNERNQSGQLAQLDAFIHLVQAAARHGVGKIVGIGSQGEYGRTTGRTDEEALPRPTSLYGATKLAAALVGERLAANLGVTFAWLRLFAIYGPGDNSNWLIPGTLAAFREARSPPMTPGTQKVDYLFIDDAAAGVMAVAETTDATGVFNLASGQAVTVRRIVEQLRDLAAPGLTLRFGDIPFAPHHVMHMEGAIERLHDATGWRPRVSLEEGLARLVATA